MSDTHVQTACEFEFASADFEDAYCHINHHDDELRNCLVAMPPANADDKGAPELAVLCKLGFGSKGGPDVWSRISAACGRLTQSIQPSVKPIPAPQAKVNIYLDDPFWTLFGDKTTRDLQLGFALMILLACGFRISWRKGARGTAVEWIGLLYSLDNSSNTASISIPKITAEDISVEAKALSELSMIPLSRLRKFTGKASWVMNIIPRTRWAVQRLWAAVSKQEAVAKSHRSGVRFSRRPCLVASKQSSSHWCGLRRCGHRLRHYCADSSHLRTRRQSWR
jgi:hypothetical protein